MCVFKRKLLESFSPFEYERLILNFNFLRNYSCINLSYPHIFCARGYIYVPNYPSILEHLNYFTTHGIAWLISGGSSNLKWEVKGSSTSTILMKFSPKKNETLSKSLRVRLLNMFSCVGLYKDYTICFKSKGQKSNRRKMLCEIEYQSIFSLALCGQSRYAWIWDLDSGAWPTLFSCFLIQIMLYNVCTQLT